MNYPEHLSDKDITTLSTAGIDGDEAFEYCWLGLDAAAEMVTFKAAGLDAAAVSGYLMRRLLDFDEVLALHTAGIGPEDYESYRPMFGASAPSVAEILEWKSAGIDGDDVFGYQRMGALTLTEMLPWKAAGIDGIDAYQYHLAGATSLAEAQQWHAAGISGGELRYYRKAGVSTVPEALELRAAGISPSIAHHYEQFCGVTGVASLLRLARLGCDPDMCRDIVRPALKQSGDAVVERVLAVGDDLNRFPIGTLRALGRPSRLAEYLLAASDGDLKVAVVLAEDRYASTGKVSVPFIRQSIGIL